MDDLISRQAAFISLEKSMNLNQMRERLKRLPSADAPHELMDWQRLILEKMARDISSAEKAQLSGEDATKDATSDLISRKDAIDVAKQHWYKPEIVKALEELPSAQPDVPDICVGDMISRQAAIDACIRVREHHAYDEIEEIKALPSAEPQITHCKDCKHHWTHRCMDSMPTEVCDLNQTFYDPNIDFCSLAERRADE